MLSNPLLSLPLPGVLSVVVLVSVVTGCAPVRAVSIDPGPYPRSGVEYFPDPAGVAVPPGHQPPPGECRIWFPERPPGQQPPPGNCYELQYRVPPGAVLIRG